MNQRSTGARAYHERNVYGNIAYYMFRAGGISINYRVRGADAENPPDIIRVFKCDSCSSYGMDQGMATTRRA